VTRRRTLVAAIAAVLAAQAAIHAERRSEPPTADVEPAASAATRHHYTISARVRPLVLFWITRSNVGDAVVERTRAPEQATYSLLIGTDPKRTPLGINRWGYLEEEIRGGEARLLGVMTESDEESIEQAEANVRKQPAGNHPFKIIHATADGAEARARVASINAPEDYTLKELPAVLDLVARQAAGGSLRVVPLANGTRPGFLAALADAMHTPAERSISYIYYGRLYELRRTRSTAVPDLRIAARSYGPAVAADFVITSAHDGERTKFSMTYGTRGRYAEVPLAASYQPRWWMQIELAIDDTSADGQPAQ